MRGPVSSTPNPAHAVHALGRNSIDISGNAVAMHFILEVLLGLKRVS